MIQGETLPRHCLAGSRGHCRTCVLGLLCALLSLCPQNAATQEVIHSTVLRRERLRSLSRYFPHEPLLVARCRDDVDASWQRDLGACFRVIVRSPIIV